MAFEGGAVVVSRPKSFMLKGVMLPMTLLELRDKDVGNIAHELTQKVEQAPSFFEGSPIVVSLELLDVDGEFLSVLVDTCLGLGFRLVGIKGDGEFITSYAKQHKLAHFPGGKVKAAPSNANDIAVGTETHAPAKSPATFIAAPVRSGQQVYAAGDLVVMAPVSAGAELLAEGCIHVYAPMRGRALAGVKGDEAARIFCMSQEAELVSIAGHFMIDENLRGAHWRQATQIYFDGDELKVERLLA